MDFALIGNGKYQALIDARGEIVWLCWPRFDSEPVFASLIGGQGRCAIETDLGAKQEYVSDTNIVRTQFGEAFEVLDYAPPEQLALVRLLRPLSGAPRVRVVIEGDVEVNSDAPIGESFVLSEPVEIVVGEAHDTSLSRTTEMWRDFVASLRLPSMYRSAVVRSALALKLHQFSDTGAITAAATTSITEYPGSGRTWDYRYCWLRDAYFTLLALRGLGRDAERRAFVDFVKRIAAPRLQPLYSVMGEAKIGERTDPTFAGYRGEGPVRFGNAAYAQTQNDVYGEVLACLRDEPALRAQMLQAIDATMEEPDAGLWEIRDTPKLHTFSLLMHWYGATCCGDARLAARARALIEQRCYRAAGGFYADAASTDHADAALFMMVNLGYVDGARAASHVDALAAKLRVTDALLQRYVHHDGIGDTHGTFTVCGFWYAEALARIGRIDQARDCIDALLGYANHVGLYSEDIDPNTGEQWGNFPQTYSHAGLINAVLALDGPRA